MYNNKNKIQEVFIMTRKANLSVVRKKVYTLSHIMKY